MACERCTDPSGACCFPVYGVGPHTHRPGPVIGSTEPLTEEQWPDGYTEDPDAPGLGVWWCPQCGAGKPETHNVTIEPHSAARKE